MKLKLDDKGNAVLQDGKPVYVHDDGKEVAFDAAATVATISRLNNEAKGHREAKEAAEAKLKAFEGLDDPKAARDALKTVANLKDKQLVDAGEVEKVKAEAIKAAEDKFTPIVEERDTLKSQLHNELIGGRFSRSQFISEKLAIPADLVQARFGNNFKIEGGQVIGYDGSGNKIFSRARPGEAADFDEAMEFLVGAYPQKDKILKGTNGGGSGARGSEGGGGGGAKTKTRAEFDAMSPAERMAFAKDSGRVTDVAT